MSVNRPVARLSFDDHSSEIAGQQADVTILAAPGGVGRIVVTAAGAAGAYVEVYDGAVATGVRVGHAIGVADATGKLANEELNVWCSNSIHVKTVDSGGNLRVVILGDFR